MSVCDAQCAWLSLPEGEREGDREKERKKEKKNESRRGRRGSKGVRNRQSMSAKTYWLFQRTSVVSVVGLASASGLSMRAPPKT